MPTIVTRRHIRYSREEITEAIIRHIETTSGMGIAPDRRNSFYNGFILFIKEEIEFELPDQVAVMQESSAAPSRPSLPPTPDPVPAAASSPHAEEAPPPPPLSSRGWTGRQVQEMIRLKADGLGNKEISQFIGKTPAQISVKWDYLKKRGQLLPSAAPNESAAQQPPGEDVDDSDVVEIDENDADPDPDTGRPSAGALDFDPFDELPIAASPPSNKSLRSQVIRLWEEEGLSVEQIADRLSADKKKVAHIVTQEFGFDTLSEAKDTDAAKNAKWNFAGDNLQVRD